MTDLYNQYSEERVFSIKAERRITGEFDIVENGEGVWILMQDKNLFILLDDSMKPCKEYVVDESLLSGKVKKVVLHPLLERFVVLTEDKLYGFSFDGVENECPVEGMKWIKYSSDGELLWGVEYMSDKRFRVSVRDASLSLLATEVFEDELYRSEFMFTQLPETNHIYMSQFAGQDGSMNSFLTYVDGTIEMHRIPQLDDFIVPEFRKDKKEFVSVMYPEGFYTFTYPGFEKGAGHEMNGENGEFCGFFVFYLNDYQIVYERHEHIWLLFDLKLKASIGSFIIEGHEPKESFHYYPLLKDRTGVTSDVYSLRSYGNYVIGQYHTYRTGGKSDYLFIIENFTHP